MALKINIIGAGIAGLSTGCYLQMKGFDTEIFESHSSPGGLCTSWKRGEYTVDGCLHWIIGINPADPVHALWKELIDLDSIRFHVYDEFIRVRDLRGNEIVGYADLGKLKKELLVKAPEDRAVILEFIQGVEQMSRMKMRMDKAPELYNLKDKFGEFLSFLPYLRTLIPGSKMTIHEFAGRCKNPLLARFFEFTFASDMPILFIMMTFAWLNNRTAGYPIGGSLKFSQMFEKRYNELGGKIHYNSLVKEILTEKCQRQHRASGIVLENGQIFPSDITISCADGHSTIFGMLRGRFADRRVKRYFTDFSVFPSFIKIAFGVARTFEGEPSVRIIPLEEPFIIDPEKTIDNIYCRIFNFDPTLAPAGKTLITCMVKTNNYLYWADLRRNNRGEYDREKRRLGEFFAAALERELGGIHGKIEMTDISTPATLIRYTHNWKGSIEGWLVTKETGFNSLPKELPGLKDFYMAGQWVEPGGGVPSAFLSGRNLAQVIRP